MNRRRRSGFTLIELLVVIGIILLLIAIGVIGFQHLDAVASEKATKATLETCTSILKEYQTNTGSMTLVEGGDSLAGYTYVNSVNPPTAAIASPGDVNTVSDPRQNDRYSQNASNNMAVINTAKVTAAMSHVPAVKTILSQLPPQNILQSPANLSQSLPWMDSNNHQYYVLLDAWHNPIIYVPSGGMTGVNLNGHANAKITARDGGPFWASAGPDGNLQYGDDNVYSTSVIVQ